MHANWLQVSPLPWMLVSSSVKPPNRWGHSSCIVKDCLYIFGGFANSTYMNDLWRYSLNEKAWQQITTYGDVPPCRSNSTLVYDSVNEQLLLFGGGGPNKQRFNTVSTLDLNNFHWFEIPPFESEASPWERTYHVAQFKFPYLLVFGGEGADDLGDLWVYNVTTLGWEQIKIYGQKPSARRFHSSCMVDTCMYIFGGCFGKYNCLSDFYYLDISPLLETGQTNRIQWKKVELRGQVTQRWGHTSNYYNGEIYVFGGRSAEDMNDLLAINIQTGVVRKVLTSNQPAARRRHSGGFIGSCLVMFGGFDGNYYDDLFYINLFQPKSKTYTLKPAMETLVKPAEQYLLDADFNPFCIYSVLIGKYFKHQRKMVSFLQSINQFYPRQILQQTFTSLYVGFGKIPLQQAHLKLMSWCPPQHSAKPNQIIQSFIQETSNSITQNQQESFCVQLQNRQFNSYLMKIEDHWQMNNHIILNNQYNFNCCFELMAIYNKYFKYLFSTKETKQHALNVHFDCKPSVFQIFLSYLHTNILVISSQFSYNVYKELIQLAQYFSIDRLVHICEEQLIKNISLQNYEDLLAFSSEYRMEHLEEICSLKYLLQLTESRTTKDGLVLTPREEENMDSKIINLYNQLKFDFVHICEQKWSEKSSKSTVLCEGKENMRKGGLCN